MPRPPLVQVDALEALVIIDNELDPLSNAAPDTVHVSGSMAHLALSSPHRLRDRGDASRELRMDDICCAAHGLSILVTATKGDVKHSVLFDTGPEEEAWERNVKRLRADLSRVELIQLSHWHRDHSGGMLKAIRMIKDAKQAKGLSDTSVVVDVHPSRPDYRGFGIGETIVSLEADPTFEEMEEAGATVNKSSETHTVLDDMFLISGEIPRVTSYENGLKGALRFDSEEGDWFSDEMINDERFLMCNLKGKGIVMFTGCSHAGVVNSAKHAKELLKGSVPLYAVVGGFHLASSDEAHVESTVSDLEKLDPAVLLPGHCSGWRAKFAIEQHMPGRLVPCTVGSKITF
ncbi:metallo-beta-lactamase superfamily protein [Thermoascus aurantiacus ATCC 26904]